MRKRHFRGVVRGHKVTDFFSVRKPGTDGNGRCLRRFTYALISPNHLLAAFA